MTFSDSNITYNSITGKKYKWVEATPGATELTLQVVDFSLLDESETRLLSYSAPSNCIYVTITPKAPISYFEVRTTAATAAYGIGVGVRARYRTNLAANTQCLIPVPIDATTFPKENLALTKTFRVSFYSKRTSDGIWDAFYLLIDSNGKVIVPTQNNGIAVCTDEAIPEN